MSVNCSCAFISATVLANPAIFIYPYIHCLAFCISLNLRKMNKNSSNIDSFYLCMALIDLCSLNFSCYLNDSVTQ